MKKITDYQKALEIIERLDVAKIGEHKKWKSIIRKIKNNKPLSIHEIEYYTNISRIYKNSTISRRSRIYHTKLSENDDKPPCLTCGNKSQYYCNMNDQYFCIVHVVGHDDNEI